MAAMTRRGIPAFTSRDRQARGEASLHSRGEERHPCIHQQRQAGKGRRGESEQGGGARDERRRP
jgi:hypothetical protein